MAPRERALRMRSKDLRGERQIAGVQAPAPPRPAKADGGDDGYADGYAERDIAGGGGDSFYARLIWCVDVAELASWPAAVLLLGFCYNSVGVLASWRGVDYAPILTTRWDSHVPFVPLMIVPYVYAYAMPLVYVGLVAGRLGIQGCLPTVRRFYLAQVAVLLCGYALYVALPVSIATLATPRPSGAGDDRFLAAYAWSFVQVGMTTFNAFPSLHVASTLSIAMIQTAEGLPGSAFARGACAVVCASTVLTRAHFLMDVPGGVLLALAVDTAVYRPLARREQSWRQGACSDGGSLLLPPREPRQLLQKTRLPQEQEAQRWRQGSVSDLPSLGALALRAAAVVAAPALVTWGKSLLAAATGTDVDLGHMARMLLGTI